MRNRGSVTTALLVAGIAALYASAAAAADVEPRRAPAVRVDWTVPMGMTLSASATDPLVNTGPAAAGALDLYLWYLCQGGIEHPWEISAFIARLDAPSGIEVSDFDPSAGVINYGEGADLMLFLVPCRSGVEPFVLGVFHIVGNGEGSFCLVNSPVWWDELGADLDCNCLSCFPWGVPELIGYAAGSGPASCIEPLPCGTTPVASRSWGRIKSLYR